MVSCHPHFIGKMAVFFRAFSGMFGFFALEKSFDINHDALGGFEEP
jgi:hypothetical protein